MMEPSKKHRRRLVGPVLALAAAASVTTLPAVAQAAPVPAKAVAKAALGPAQLSLPAGFRPEGITSIPGGTDFFAGSMVDGRIWKGSLATGQGSVVVPGVTGRALRGMVYDPRSGLVWTVGTQGTGGIVLAVNARTGAVAYTYTVPDAQFLNDLAIAPTGIWVTDSRVERLLNIALGTGGLPAGSSYTTVPLTGAWPVVGNTRANGIRPLVDGSLLLAHSGAGGLWRVDPATGAATAVPIVGGSLTGGDGIELAGNLAYVVRGNGTGVSVLKLGYGAGLALTARWQGVISDPTFDVPSTTTRNGKYLYSINARFGVANPGAADYWVTRTPFKP
ncbi:NHL repeat-containing protein [Motilibacter aurantiacus]|uniref:hypothetical protein n=1 Tax=Motilibacter aurantiacus TaxID=2714955 RepID=UPI00140E1214|nr:hypothetical protein [Motilibacter aurantiacus]NHC46424.1 hypothetical protein [Motilibacter aurantiacus]